MSKRKKVIIIVCVVLLNIFMISCFICIRRATEENDLRREVDRLSKLDITKDRYNTSIKTSGGYGVVEKAIKEYLDDYAVGMQKVLGVLQDEKLTKILSYDNYVSDGPEFNSSLSYLSSTKESFNSDVDSLVKKLDEDEIKSYIKTKTKKKYYIDLYNELMLSNEMKNDFSSTKEVLTNMKSRVNNIFDTSSEVLNYLVLYKSDWVCEDGQIKFKTNDEYNYYNNLISKVNNSVKSES